MAFDIVNGVAHFKITHSTNDTDVENIKTLLANYISTWSFTGNYFIPSWTNSAKIRIFSNNNSSSGGIGVQLVSINKEGEINTTCFKTSHKVHAGYSALSQYVPCYWTTTNSSWSYFYLNIIKSKNGRSFAFSFSHNPSNQMTALAAESETGEIALFQLGGAYGYVYSGLVGNYFSSYQFLARDEKLLARGSSADDHGGSAFSRMQGSFLCLDPIIKPNIKTSLVRTPNLLGNNLFKELYSIMSTSIPLNELDDAIFIIDGHKYKPIMITSIAQSGSFGYPLTRCAGPFALEIE